MDAIHPSDFKTLERVLQKHVQTHFSPETLRLQCAVKEDVLMILGQHPAEVKLTPQAFFQRLEQEVRTLDPHLQPGHPQRVQLYLRVQGQLQPYTFHCFTIEPDSSSKADPDPEQETNNLTEAISRKAVPDLTTSAIARVNDDLDLSLTDDDGLDLTLSEPDMSQFQATPPSPSTRWRLPLLLAGSSLAVGAGVLLLYGLTRPCVLGGCSPIQSAQALDQSATELLQRSQQEQDILTAKNNLILASRKLAPIPSWSGQKNEAQLLAQRYQNQITALDHLLAGYQQAKAAAQKSLNPPHPIPHWREVQTLWRNAILQVKQVPANDPAYRLAQEKLKQYQTNLAAIETRIQLERQTKQALAEAKVKAKLAETLEGLAQDVEGWQKTQATWQIAVNLTQKISAGTTSYREAQSLLADYQAKLVTARNRTTREQLAIQTYQQAQKLGREARQLEKKANWSMAVASWREALQHAKQVPADTFYAKQGAALVQAYTVALGQAESQSTAANLMQQTRTDLKRTCSNAIRICEFTLTPTLIKVKLTSNYTQTVLRTGAIAYRNQDVNTQLRVNAHLKSLQTALETISRNSGIPIEIYNANNTSLGRYVP